MNQVPLLHQAGAESLARKKVNGKSSEERSKTKSVKGAEMGKNCEIQGELKYDTLLRYLSHVMAMGAGILVVRYQGKIPLIGLLLIVFVIGKRGGVYIVDGLELGWWLWNTDSG